MLAKFPYYLLIIFLFNSCINSDLQSEMQVTQSFMKENNALKAEFDPKTKNIYWLNTSGEIYRMPKKGKTSTLINKGFGIELGITLIGDFTLDIFNRKIYFTDLFDMNSGKSAIKSSDMEGKNIETVIVFKKENPVQLSVNYQDNVIHYVSRAKTSKNQEYYLGMIELEDLTRTQLFTSTSPIDLKNLPGVPLGIQPSTVMLARQ